MDMKETTKKYLAMVNKNYMTKEMVEKSIEGSNTNLMNTVNHYIGTEYEIANLRKQLDSWKVENEEFFKRIEEEGVFSPFKEEDSNEFKKFKGDYISCMEQINTRLSTLTTIERNLNYYYECIDGYREFLAEME